MPRISPYIIQRNNTEKSPWERQARKLTSPYYAVLRAKLIRLAAHGQQNGQIAASLSVPRQIVSQWRKRCFEERLAGLEDEPRTGRPPVFPPRSGRAGQGAGL